MKLQRLFCWRKLCQFAAIRLSKQKVWQPVKVTRTKAIAWIISSTYRFFNQIEFIFVLLSSVQLNLVKVSVMFVLWYNTFHQVLFDMSKNENVISSSLTSLAPNFTVHRNEYNSTPKIMCQQLTCKKSVQGDLFLFLP